MTLGMFNRYEFVDFVIGNLRNRFPDVMFYQREDDFHWELVFSDGLSLRLYLGNIWQDYNISRDIRTILSFLSAQESACVRLLESAKKAESNDKIFNFERVYPVIRTVGFMHMSKPIARVVDDFVYRSISDDLVMLFAEDSDDYFFFITKNNGLPMSDKELMALAEENLMGHGWLKPDDGFSTNRGSLVCYWEEYSRPYQAQFFLYDWAKEFLGDTYFIACPSIYITLVYKPVSFDIRDPILIEDLSYFKELALQLYNKSEKGLSHIVHQVSNGQVSIIG